MSSAVLLLQKMTDFKEQCTCIELFHIGKIVAETFQMLTLAFIEEAVRQTVVFYCAEYRNGMTSLRMLNIQGACLLAECTEMWNIFMGFDIKVDGLLSASWLMSRAAFWFMLSDFDTRLDL